jgi:hypothetical protein
MEAQRFGGRGLYPAEEGRGSKCLGVGVHEVGYEMARELLGALRRVQRRGCLAQGKENLVLADRLHRRGRSQPTIQASPDKGEGDRHEGVGTIGTRPTSGRGRDALEAPLTADTWPWRFGTALQSLSRSDLSKEAGEHVVASTASRSRACSRRSQTMAASRMGPWGRWAWSRIPIPKNGRERAWRECKSSALGNVGKSESVSVSSPSSAGKSANGASAGTQTARRRGRHGAVSVCRQTGHPAAYLPLEII